MVTSTTVGLLGRVAELARRNGLRPSQAEANYRFDMDEEGHGHHVLWFEHEPCDPEIWKKFQRFMALLGSDLETEESILRTATIAELEDRVEAAIARSPRARIT